MGCEWLSNLRSVTQFGIVKREPGSVRLSSRVVPGSGVAFQGPACTLVASTSWDKAEVGGVEDISAKVLGPNTVTH